MKKYFLFGALAVASLLNAQRVNLPQVEKVSFAGQSKSIQTDGWFEWKDAETFMNERKAYFAEAQYDAVDYYYAPGAFHNGFDEGLMGFSFAAIILPYLDSVEYINIYGATDWSINKNLVAENTDTYFAEYWMGEGAYYVPETADHDLVYGSKTYKIKGTSYGNTAASSGQYVFCALPDQPSMLGGSNLAMTLCAMECDTLEDSQDWWRIGGNATGDTYQYGTGMHLDSADRATTADTMGIIVNNLGVMKFDRIVFTIFSDGVAELEGVIPADAELRLAIFPVTSKGIDFTDTIARTTMTQSDFEGQAYSWGMAGTLTAKFFETDIFGSVTEVPVWANGDFYVQLTNYNESGCNFGIFADWNCPVTATTVFQHDGKFSYRAGRSGGGKYGQNLLVSFVGYFPTLVSFEEEKILYADVEADSKAHFNKDEEPSEDNVEVVLYSNVNPDDWNVESDADWVSFDYTSEYFEEYQAGVLMFVADALPEGEKGRYCTVTIEADGATQEFLIAQGEVELPDAVESTKIDVRFDGKTYNVQGIEVGDDYKGVVIRNGEKSIR